LLGRLGTLPRVFFALFVVALLTRTANGISRARQICIDIAIPSIFDLFDLDEGSKALNLPAKRVFCKFSLEPYFHAYPFDHQ